MLKKYILFLSTNGIWGGSEVLWTQCAKQLAGKGYKIKVGSKYGYGPIKEYVPNRGNFIDLENRIVVRHLSIFLRVLQKSGFWKFPPKYILYEDFNQAMPDLVIISQGNNIDGKEFMKDCIRFKIPFVTITQLVTADFWPSLNDALIDELRELYRKAKCNYFVSVNTLQLHEKLLGEKLTNSAIVFNPFTKKIPPDNSFPVVENGIYKVALIGRIETFHKGYDLLIDVLKEEKWKKRSIQFSLFGKGPHVELLKRLIKQNNITNISIYNHVENVDEIWKSHHILMMPSRMEGQSLSLIEAMRFSRAAIVTDVGGTVELIEEGINGFIAEYPTPYFIDAALERAWGKRNEWEQLGINAASAIAAKHPEDAVSFFNKQIEDILVA